MTTILIEQWLREKLERRQREALRAAWMAASLGAAFTFFAYLILTFAGLMLFMLLSPFRFSRAIPWLFPPGFLVMVTILYRFLQRKPPRQLVSLGDTPDAPIVSLDPSVPESDFDIFEQGTHFSYLIFVLSLVLAPGKFFWLTMRELHRVIFPEHVNVSEAARVIELLLEHSERVSFTQVGQLGGQVAAVLPAIARLAEVHLLTSPPGIALTTEGRVELCEYIESRDGVVPEAVHESAPKAAPMAAPQVPAPIDLPDEIANSSGELPPQPLMPSAEGVMPAPVGRLPERGDPNAPYNPFALLVEDNNAGKLDPTVQPAITPQSHDDKPLELA